ncbi:MAG TPA: hypothetical protein DCG57_00040 [Candidatus Riflebacteria bacterium]|jgi:vitamin B12 transporter|nr:hypothetical protein [Candidatus Riflebacteria bacterium]
MLRTLFVTLLFCISGSFLHAAEDTAQLQPPADFDLGTLTVAEPSWNHPEEITGKPDGETYFEILSDTGKTTISEALDGQMGINLRISGGAGHIAAISSGGLSGNKILVVKDGMPINDPFTGSPDIGDFSTLQYDKAELWKGNRATLWGSSSIGGTLRLTSRFPDSGRLRLWTDGFGGNGRAVETSIYPGKARIGIRLSQFTTPGFSAAAPENGNSERDAFELTSGYVAMETDLRKDLQLQVSAESNESMTDLDGFDFVSGLPADNLTFRQKKLGSQFNIGLTSHLNNGELRLAHIFNHSTMTGIDESDPFNEFGLEVSRQKQSVSRSYQAGSSSYLGEIARTETRAENHGLFVHRESDLAIFLAAQNQLRKELRANITARYDDPQNHNGVFTGNLALVRTGPQFELSAAWGQAFRMPALNERYYPAYGDPGLNSEHSTSFGLTAAKKVADIGKIAVSATRYQVRDLIGTTSTADPAYTWGIKAANLDRATLISHQLSLSECKLAGFELSGELSLMDKKKLANSGKQVPGIADRQAAFSLTRNIARTKYSLHTKFWGSTWEDAENTRKASPDHELSLYIRRSFKECSFEIGVLNLTNSEKARVLGYTRPGRRLALALEAFF